MSIFDKRRDPADEAGHRTDFDTMPEGPADVRTKPLSDREIARALAEHTLCELQRLNETMSAMAAAQRSQIVNNVLEVASYPIDSSGTLVRTFPTQVGSIIVTNPTGNTMTVQAGTSGSTSAPTIGRGVQLVPANSWIAIPIASHSFTVYGTAGASVGLQVFGDMTAFGRR